MAAAPEVVSPRPVPKPFDLTSPRFLAFLTAQFLGVTKDYAFRIMLILFVLSIVSSETRQVRYSSVATALVPLPFLLFSPVAGYLADRLAKHRVLVAAKLLEIAAMLLAVLGFHLGSIPFLFFVLFCTSASNTFLQPPTDGILPEIFGDNRISAANGVLELTVDLAALIGSVLGIYLYSRFTSNLTQAGLVLVAIACAGTAAMLFAPRAPAGNRDAALAWNPLASMRRDYAEVRDRPTLYYTLMGIAWFGFIVSFLVTVIPVFGKSDLGLPSSRAGLMFGLVTIGMGGGGYLAGLLSHDRVEIGLVPIGSAGITIFSLMLACSGAGLIVPVLGVPIGAATCLVLLGFSCGFFLIPLKAALQQRAPDGMKGRLVAFANSLAYGAILVAAGIPWIIATCLGWNARQALLFVALLTLGGTIYVVVRLPDFLVRFLVWSLTNSVYRIRVVGSENLPKGGALIVGNHVTLIDGPLVTASTSRAVRQFVFRPYTKIWWLKWYFRANHAIPIADTDSKETIEAALETARDVIRRGHIMCIFAEGSMTRTGNMLRFRRGLERIAGQVNCPIVPFYLDGVWGSIFSYERGRFLFKWPRHLLQPITIVFGKPMPSTSTADEVRQAIQELSTQTFTDRQKLQAPLHVRFIRRAKQRWKATLAIGENGSTISFGAALSRAIALSETLWCRDGQPGERVGILMPPGIDAILVNFAALYAGRVPVNIDAVDVRHAAVSRAQLATIVTTRKFAEGLDSAQLSPAEIRYFEDADAAVSAERLRRITRACRIMPAWFIARRMVRGNTTDGGQVATILFSYRAGDQAPPQGVMLTHHNLLSNLESLRQVFRVTRDDCILGLLPFSNAIGLASMMLLPALAGARVAFGAELLGKPALGEFCRSNRITLIPANPAILASAIDTVEAADLAHLRHVAIGAGHLDDQLRAKFRSKFGIEPLQGYGYPECAPLVALNVPDFRDGDEHQPGTRAGTVGQPVPGISVRIVDPSSGERLAAGIEGMLLVGGPNIMKGYIDGPEATSRVMRGTWFVTGDRASIDHDGFLTIAPNPASQSTRRDGFKSRHAQIPGGEDDALTTQH